MDPNPNSFPVLSYVMSKLPFSKTSSTDPDIEQPSDRPSDPFPNPIESTMPQITDPKTLKHMTIAISDVAQARSVLQALGDRPDHESVDGARAKIAEIETTLAKQLEEIVLSPRPPDVDRLDWRGHLSEKENEIRDAAMKERKIYESIIELDEMHDAYEKMLRESEEKLMMVYRKRVEEGEKEGEEEEEEDEIINEEVVGILGRKDVLERVDLSGKRLKFVPEEFGRIKGLVSLNLSNNQLEMITDSIAGLEKLEELNLSSNLLEALPDSIGLLHNLKILNVCGNKLHALPDSIFHCSCGEETINWEFGFTTPSKETGTTTETKEIDDMKSVGNNSSLINNEVGKNVKRRTSKFPELKLIDPDEVVDPATLDNTTVSDEEDSNDASDNSDYASDSSLQPYDLSDDDTDLKTKFSQLVDVVGALRKTDNPDGVLSALDVAEKLVRASPSELRHVAGDLVGSLVRVRCSDVSIEGEEESAEEKRQGALIALLVTAPLESVDTLSKILYSSTIDTSQRILILDVMTEAAQELADTKIFKQKHQPRTLISTVSDNQAWFLPSSVGPLGASSWKERSNPESPLNWSYSYERDLLLRPGQVKRGKTRRWSMISAHARDNQSEVSQNKFPLYAAAFMLPAMQGFDKKRHGVDLLGRDFIVLGKLIYMLGVCMKCASMHPEASALAPYLLNMLSSRDICHHAEAYVRRSALFAASCVLVALHPSHIASALVQGNAELSRGLEWIRTWALQVAESDTNRECYTMAMACLQLHAEMALQASRALDSTGTSFKGLSIGLPGNITKETIKIPHSSVKY